MTRTTIPLDDQLLAEAEHRAARAGTSVSQLIEDTLREAFPVGAGQGAAPAAAERDAERLRGAAEQTELAAFGDYLDELR